MRVYLSGPITGTQGSRERFGRAERMFAERGIAVVNPERTLACMPEGLVHGDYMHVALAMLDICDVVYMMRGWRRSKGCKMEIKRAEKLKKVIFFEGGENEEEIKEVAGN